MTEGQTLFLVLSLLYLSDCLLWLGKRSVLFSEGLISHGRYTLAGEYAGNSTGSVIFLNPAPIFDGVYVSHLMPVSISPIGICAATPQSQLGNQGPTHSGEALLYSDIVETDSDGKYLILNDARFAKCYSPEQATIFAELINNLRTKPSEARETQIQQFLSAQFSEHEALQRLSQVNQSVKILRWSCLLFFISLYILTPVFVSIYGLAPLIIPIAITTFLFAILIALQFLRSHKALYSDHSTERWINLAKMVVSPPTAIRAVDRITLKALSQFHPLLLANIFLGPNKMGFVGSFIKNLRHPLSSTELDSKAQQIVTWYSKTELEACETFLKKQNPTTIEKFFAPPVWDGASTDYCPRCSCQFTGDGQECPDCQGVKLIPISAEVKSEAAHE